MVKAIEDRRGVGYDGEGDRGEERCAVTAHDETK